MKIPGAERAFIDPQKLTDYLLSPIHPVGRFKAAWFARLGFTLGNWPLLQARLSALARSDAATDGPVSEHGHKYEVRGMLEGPSRSAPVVTVWMVRVGEDHPRLVTAFPGEE